MLKRINFIIAGVQKGGTTALDAIFRRHSGIAMPSIKEVHYFDNEAVNWNSPDYSDYHRFFDWQNSDQIRGEATPIYTYWPQSLERIHSYDPSIKLIITLRHPVHRAFSHWRMETSRGDENLPFDEAICAGRARVGNVHRVYSYVERGFYARQVERILSLFPSHQVLFMKTDDLWENSHIELGRVASFLKITPLHSVAGEYIVPLPTASLGEISDESKAYLQGLFKDDLEKTATLTGLDLSSWAEMTYSEPMTQVGNDKLIMSRKN